MIFVTLMVVMFCTLVNGTRRTLEENENTSCLQRINYSHMMQQRSFLDCLLLTLRID